MIIDTLMNWEDKPMWFSVHTPQNWEIATKRRDKALIANDELKRIVFYKQPKAIYDRLPDEVVAAVLQDKPIAVRIVQEDEVTTGYVDIRTAGNTKSRWLRFMQCENCGHKKGQLGDNEPKPPGPMCTSCGNVDIDIDGGNWKCEDCGASSSPKATAKDIADIQAQLAACVNDPNFTSGGISDNAVAFYCAQASKEIDACKEERAEIDYIKARRFKLVDQMMAQAREKICKEEDRNIFAALIRATKGDGK